MQHNQFCIYKFTKLVIIYLAFYFQAAKRSWNPSFRLLIFRNVGKLWIKWGTVTHHILWSPWCMLWTSGRCWTSVWGAFWSRTAAEEHTWRVASLVQEKENSCENQNQSIRLEKSRILDLPLLECAEECVHVRNRERKRKPGARVCLWHGNKVVAVFVFQPGIGRRVHQPGDQVWMTAETKVCFPQHCLQGSCQQD